jgi:hypothetical protein
MLVSLFCFMPLEGALNFALNSIVLSQPRGTE